MNPEYLEKMSSSELAEYAEVLGIKLDGRKSAKSKIEQIEKQRGRTVSMRVLGVDIEIPIKRMHDKRVSDLFAKGKLSDAETEGLMELIVGAEQMESLIEACTEPDGTVDTDALALAFAKILTNQDLKNF